MLFKTYKANSISTLKQDAMNPAYDINKVTSILKMLQSTPGALLPILHAVQDALGWIPPDSVAHIAGALNLSRAEVHGVITFYHHFRTTAPARHAIQICSAEACQSMGAEQLVRHAEKQLGCRLHEHSSDGGFSLEPVYCLGQCATSPAIMIDGAVHARVTPAKLNRLIEKAKVAA